MQVSIANQKEVQSRTEYFRQMTSLAAQTRAKYPDQVKKLSLTSIRTIYKEEGICLDYREIKSARIRAMYLCDEVGCTVMVKKSLPREPKLFSLLHELKHHLVDREIILAGELICGNYNENEQVEIGAEVFAAEFIYPEVEVRSDWSQFGMQTKCCAADIVRFKRACNRPVSYTTLVKRLTFLKFVDIGQFDGIQFKRLEDTMFPPFYKEPWYINYRKRRKFE